jgi:hypothetical protein
MIGSGEDKSGRNHAISTQLCSWPADPVRTLALWGSPGFLLCAAAGLAARSGARTGPARRPAAAAEGRS